MDLSAQLRLPALGLLLALGAALPADAAAEILANGDFEADPGADAAQPIPDWRFFVWSGAASATRDDSARPAGGRSARLEAAAPGKAAIHQKLTLPAGRHRLSALVAAHGLTAGKDRLTARLHVELAGSRAVFVAIPEGDLDWTQAEAVFDLEVETAATVYVFLYGSGRLWVDDLRIAPLDPATPAQPGARIAAAPLEPLRFDPPLTPEDLLLEPYCDDPGMAGRPYCRRLQGRDLAALRPPRLEAPRTLASFDPPRPMGERAGHLDLNPTHGLPADWTGYDTLEIRLDNPGERTLDALVEIRDGQSRNYWSRVNWYTQVPPGPQVVRIPLQVFVGEKSVIRERRRLDTSDITRLFVDLIGPGEVHIAELRLASEPPLTADFPRLIKLDPGTPTSPVMAGFTPLTAGRLYRPDAGYGLSAEARVERNEDRRHPDDLLRDWISISRGGLAFELPDGDYRVWMMLEDPGYWEYVQNYDRRAVRAEGLEVYADTMTPSDLWARLFAHQHTEDLPGDDTWGRYIPPRYQPIEFPVSVRDGRLDLEFATGRVGTFANTLSALLIWPLEEDARARRYIDALWERLRAKYEVEYAETPPPLSTGAAAPEATPGLTLFQRHWDREVWATDTPGPGETVERLSLALARGEAEPLTLSLHARTPLTLTGLDLDLPGLAVTPYTVRSKITRSTDDGARYQKAPRLLDPLRLPLDLARGQSRRLWLAVRAPEDTPAGIIRGSLRLTFGDGQRVTLPVQARVRPFVLPVADIPIGYLGSVPNYPDSAFPEAVDAKRMSDIPAALHLVRDHGMTRFSGGIGGPEPAKGPLGLTIDFSRADAVLAAADGLFPFPPHSYGGLAPGGGLGFQHYRVRDTSARLGLPHQEALDRVLGAIRAHNQGRGWPEPVYTVGDEPRGADAVAQAVELARAVRTAGARSSVFTSIRDRDSHGLPLGREVDQVFVTLHTRWGLDQILAAGRDCGTYNLGGRFARGIYQLKLRRHGCRAGYFHFAFDSTHVDPYYALDGREEDFAAAFPSAVPGVLIPSLELFRFGEAVDDYRYLLALEQAIARAPDTREAREAAAWLAALLTPIVIDQEALVPPPLGPEDLDGMRMLASDWIQIIHAANTGDPAGSPGPASPR